MAGVRICASLFAADGQSWPEAGTLPLSLVGVQARENLMAISAEPAAKKFQRDCQDTLDWLAATEGLWLTAAPTTEVRRSLKKPQMEALYESAYLRVFAAWENFQEDLTVRFMSGAVSQNYTPIPAQGKSLHRTMKSARTDLYNGRDYLLWHNPQKSLEQIRRHIQNSSIESIIVGSQARLESYAAIRHSVAHGSEDSKRKLAAAVLSLAGTSSTTSAGKFLRSEDNSNPLNNRKWILAITQDLMSLSNAY